VLELTAPSPDDEATTSDGTTDDTGAPTDDAASADLSQVEDDADSATALGIVGIVVGAAGLLVALGALLARRRPAGPA
jgi:hypothetical protein